MVEIDEEGVLKWFERMERRTEERLTKMIYMSEVEGTWRTGRSSYRWTNGMKKILGDWGLTSMKVKVVHEIE